METLGQHFNFSLFVDFLQLFSCTIEESYRPVRATINKRKSEWSRKNGATKKGITAAGKIIDNEGLVKFTLWY